MTFRSEAASASQRDASLSRYFLTLSVSPCFRSVGSQRSGNRPCGGEDGRDRFGIGGDDEFGDHFGFGLEEVLSVNNEDSIGVAKEGAALERRHNALDGLAKLAFGVFRCTPARHIDALVIRDARSLEHAARFLEHDLTLAGSGVARSADHGETHNPSLRAPASLRKSDEFQAVPLARPEFGGANQPAS